MELGEKNSEAGMERTIAKNVTEGEGKEREGNGVGRGKSGN